MDVKQQRKKLEKMAKCTDNSLSFHFVLCWHCISMTMNNFVSSIISILLKIMSTRKLMCVTFSCWMAVVVVVVNYVSWSENSRYRKKFGRLVCTNLCSLLSNFFERARLSFSLSSICSLFFHIVRKIVLNFWMQQFQRSGFYCCNEWLMNEIEFFQPGWTSIESMLW